MSDFLFCYNFKFYYLPFALSHSLIRKSHNDNFPSHTPSRSLIDMLQKKTVSVRHSKNNLFWCLFNNFEKKKILVCPD